MTIKILRYSRQLKRRRFPENVKTLTPTVHLFLGFVTSQHRLQYFAGIRYKRVSVLPTKGQQVLGRTPEISTTLVNMESATG